MKRTVPRPRIRRLHDAVAHDMQLAVIERRSLRVEKATMVGLH